MRSYRAVLRRRFAPGSRALAPALGVFLAGALALASGLPGQDPEVFPDPPKPVPAASRTERVRPPTRSPVEKPLRQAQSRPVPTLPVRFAPQPVIGKGPRASTNREDALDAVLDTLGGLAAFRALGRVELHREVIALGETGGELFRHAFVHRADLAPGAAEDEIRWSKGLRFGQAGARAWATSSGISRPDLEHRAGGETGMWGMLLRFPFGLRDRSRFVVDGEREVTLLRRRYLRVRILERSADRRAVAVGPEPRVADAGQPVWDVFLDPVSRRPALLQVSRPGLGRRRIAFSDYRRITESGPSLPFERTILAADGETPSLVIRWKRLR